MPLASDKFTVANRVRVFHRILQVLLGLVFFGQLNYLAMRHYTRYDVTRNHFFSLSPETKAYLRALDLKPTAPRTRACRARRTRRAWA